MFESVQKLWIERLQPVFVVRLDLALDLDFICFNNGQAVEKGNKEVELEGPIFFVDVFGYLNDDAGVVNTFPA